MFRDPSDARPGYFVELDFVGGQVAGIRDFRYVPYIAEEAVFELIDEPRFDGAGGPRS